MEPEFRSQARSEKLGRAETVSAQDLDRRPV